MQQPAYCRPQAYALLAAQIPQLETDDALLASAVAIALHEMPEAKLENVQTEIQRLADRVKRRVQGTSHEALLAHLHGVLFDEEEFAGNTDDYFDPRNSYLPAVLETKRGIPISLTLLYKCVANRLNLMVHGINSPGHFLARVEMEGAWTFVDPFFGGRILTREEAVQQIEQMLGRSLPDTDHAADNTGELPQDPLFQIASHRDWLARMLRNLREVFGQAGREDDMQAMIELFGLL